MKNFLMSAFASITSSAHFLHNSCCLRRPEPFKMNGMLRIFALHTSPSHVMAGRKRFLACAWMALSLNFGLWVLAVTKEMKVLVLMCPVLKEVLLPT